MKTKILAVAFVFCVAISGFAQNKKDDDNKPCTRAQFAQLIVDTLPWVKELPDNVTDEIEISDVNTKQSNYVAIEIAIKTGIMDYSHFKKKFYPEAYTNRYEFALLFARIIEKFEENFGLKLPTVVIYKMGWCVQDYAEQAVAAMVERGIIVGYPDGEFHGKYLTTIKEVKLVLQRIKEKTEALLKEKEAAK